jgi:hypothetical protein
MSATRKHKCVRCGIAVHLLGAECQHCSHPARTFDAPDLPGAICAQTDPEAFFPERGRSSAQAKAVCAKCDVIAECLKYALEHDERFGIWGGLSEHERRRIRAAERTRAAA